jgi:transcriptional regulator with XRE-family HTH domain
MTTFQSIVPINPVTSINPLKLARQVSGLTQEDLSYYAGVTPGAILKYEQGLYENPSKKILKVLSARTGISVKELMMEYSDWRSWKRRIAYLPSVGILHINEFFHPLTQYREAAGYRSVQSFCIELCMHPAVVGKYEKAGCRSMPLMVKTALSEAGLSAPGIDIIHRKGQVYYDAVT